jgi:cobyrinic acid a,c-diamide synthase
MESLPGVASYGFLPRSESLAIPSRHLGLVTDEDFSSPQGRASDLAAWIEEHLDLDRLLEDLAKRASSHLREGSLQAEGKKPIRRPRSGARGARIGIARDEAFCFYYGENIRLLRQAGADPVLFSPLRDSGLPPGLQGLYLGGGYPELRCAELTENTDMLAEIRAFCQSGQPVYAECGGFMYLMREICDQEGKAYPMAGIFPFSARMEPRFRALGYREVVTRQPSLLGPEGTVLRGHEFHYSGICEIRAETERIYRLSDRRRELEVTEGYRRGSVLGSYIHLHFGSCPEAAAHFVQACIDATVKSPF